MTESISIRVQLFAGASDVAGSREIFVDVPSVPTVGMLRKVCAIQVPALASLLERSMIAVNHDFADDSRIIRYEDEIAVIPPVSGG